MMNKIFVLLILMLGIVIVSLVYLYFESKKYLTNVIILEKVDESRLKIISSNPDLIFIKERWPGDYSLLPCYFMSGGILEKEGTNSSFFLPWYGNAAYCPPEIHTFIERKGIFSLHPISTSVPVFLAQNITLPKRRCILVASVANLADVWNSSCSISCSDAVIKIKIFDYEKGKEDTIYEGVVDSREGWKDIYLEISKYMGRNIAFKIEGHAGGPCGEWCGEYAAVDKFYVAELIS
jgi:hypothetical protein